MERISGPFNGFYIATRAREAGGSRPLYLAAAKICRGRPDSYLDAHCCARIAGERPHPTPQDALQEAERLARARTAQLAAFAFAKSAAVDAAA